MLKLDQQLVHGPKWTINMAHEDTAHEIDYQDVALEQVASTGIHGRVVQWAENSKLTVQTGDELIVSPDMIAGGYDIDSTIKEFLCRTGSQPQTTSCVLAIANNEVNAVFST
jgi:hypothetical protein